MLCERTCFCFLSAFYKTLPSKNPSKNLVFTENPYRRLLRTLLTRPKFLQIILFKKICFGTINFVKITKQSLDKANFFACSLANRDKPVAATLQRYFFGGVIFVIITKIITKIIQARKRHINF